jgi:hypothetical protein
VARLQVEAHRRLVEEEEAGAVNQGAGDLDPPGLAAGELAHLVVHPVDEPDALQQRVHAPLRLPARDAVEARVVEEVLANGEIRVEGPALEHGAEERQRPGGLTAQVVPEDPHRAGPVVVEPRDHGEERGLARPVGTQKRHDGALRHLQRHVEERVAGAEAVADSLDRQRRDGARGRHGPSSRVPGRRVPIDHLGPATTPQG